MAKTTPGDTARDRPEKESPISVLAGRIGLPVADDGTKARAALFLHRGGNEDLWEVLGLDEYIRGRQVALGIEVDPSRRRAWRSCRDRAVHEPGATPRPQQEGKAIMNHDSVEATGLKIWECKIGEVDGDRLPPGSDEPMRDAVEAAYEKLTGERATFAFTGWGGRLTDVERAVVEDREPDPAAFVPEVELVVIGDSKLYMHTCGHLEWLSDAQRAEMMETACAGGCDACESGSDNPLDWSQLYVSIHR